MTALSPGDLATLLSQALKRPIPEEHIREIAEAGKLLNEDEKINLVEYTAFLAQEISFGNAN